MTAAATGRAALLRPPGRGREAGLGCRAAAAGLGTPAAPPALQRPLASRLCTLSA